MSTDITFSAAAYIPDVSAGTRREIDLPKRERLWTSVPSSDYRVDGLIKTIAQKHFGIINQDYRIYVTRKNITLSIIDSSGAVQGSPQTLTVDGSTGKWGTSDTSGTTAPTDTEQNTLSDQVSTIIERVKLLSLLQDPPPASSGAASPATAAAPVSSAPASATASTSAAQPHVDVHNHINIPAPQAIVPPIAPAAAPATNIHLNIQHSHTPAASSMDAAVLNAMNAVEDGVRGLEARVQRQGEEIERLRNRLPRRRRRQGHSTSSSSSSAPSSPSSSSEHSSTPASSRETSPVPPSSSSSATSPSAPPAAASAVPSTTPSNKRSWAVTVPRPMASESRNNTGNQWSNYG